MPISRHLGTDRKNGCLDLDRVGVLDPGARIQDHNVVALGDPTPLYEPFDGCKAGRSLRTNERALRPGQFRLSSEDLLIGYLNRTPGSFVKGLQDKESAEGFWNCDPEGDGRRVLPRLRSAGPLPPGSYDGCAPARLDRNETGALGI